MSLARQTLLEVRGLDAFYGLAQAVSGVNLKVARGEAVALVGRNGAGKSTTLKAIMGLIERRTDAMTFGGHDIRQQPTHHVARLGLGYVPEERRIFTDLTVAENLEVGRLAARGGRASWTPARLYEIFPNLGEMSGRSAGHMSGGEQQMLAIARTLMGNPEMVLLDEPSEGLAPVIVELMAEAIRRMKEDGIAVLLSEQNLPFAASIAERAVVIETGNITFDGSITELLDRERRQTK